MLAEGLRAAGWAVDAVVAYRTVVADAEPAVLVERAAAGRRHHLHLGLDRDGYIAAAGADAVPPAVVCIGPVTAAAAADAGIAVTAVAAEQSLDGLVAALVEVLTP